MAIPTLHLPLEGNLEGQDRNGLTSATSAGALRWVDGPRAERTFVQPLLVASPDNTEDQQGPLEPLIAGTVGLGQGQYGQTWKVKKANTPRPTIKLSPSESRDQMGSLPDVMEATENLTLNPSAETNMTSIIPVGASTSTRVGDAQAPFGSWCVKTVTQGTATYEGVYYVTSSSLGLTGNIRPFIGSVYVKGFGLLRVWLRISYSDATSTEGAGNTYTLTDAWQRLVTPVVQADPNKTITQVSLFIRTSGAQAVTMWTDAAQVEQSDHATPYVDGDMTEGTWTGTPHASSSTRARGTNLVGAVRPTEGTRTIVEEGTTNYVTNPVLNSASSWWSSFASAGSTVTATRVSTQTDMSPWVWELAVDTVASPTHSLMSHVYVAAPATPTGTFTGSITAKASRAMTAQMFVRFAYADGTVDMTPITINLGTVASRFSYTSVPVDITRTLNYIYIFLDVKGSGQAGDKVWMTQAQIENKPYATSYADGSLGSLYSWTGTAHSSTSVRKPRYSYTPPTESGWFTEDPTTNLVVNPSFEHATVMTAWQAQNVRTSYDQSVSATGTGGSLRIVNDASPLGVFTPSTSSSPYRIQVTAGQVYTLSWSMRSAQAGRLTSAAIIFRDDANTTIGSTLLTGDLTLSTSWTRFTYTTPAVPAGATFCYIVFYTSRPGNQVGDVYWLDAVQFENKPYATTYCDGSLGIGHAWTGVAHESTSTRSGASVAKNDVHTSSSRGSVIVRFIGNTNGEVTRYISALGQYSVTGQSSLRFYYSTPTGTTPTSLNLVVNSDGLTQGGSITLSGADMPAVGVWHTAIYEWDETNIYLQVDNGTRYQAAKGAALVSTFKGVYVGRRNAVNTVYHFRGSVSQHIVLSRNLTDVERAWVWTRTNWPWSLLDETDGEVRLGQEATTNLISNPSFETNTSNWFLQAVSGVTLSSTAVERSGDWSKVGNYSGKVTVTANPSSTPNSHIIRMYGELVSVSYGEVYTFSFYNKATTAGVVVTPRILPYNGATLLASYSGVAEVPDPSRRVTLTYVVPSNVTSIRVCVDYNQQSPNILLSTYVDAVQLEKKPYTTAYVDGDIADGVWTGVAHASTTTRPARADLASKKSALLRYKNNGTPTTAFIKGSQPLGTDGYARFQGGSLLLSPAEGKTLDVESVAVYDEDVEGVEGSITGVVDTWSVSNVSRFVDVPVPAVFVEEGTTNLFRNPCAFVDTYGGFAGRGIIERSTDGGVSTHTAFRLIRNDLAGTFYFNSNGGQTSGPNVMAVNATQDVTFTVWVKAQTGARLTLRSFAHGASVLAMGADVVAECDGNWQRLTMTRKPSEYSADATGVSFYVIWDNAAIAPALGHEMFVTDIQVEQKSYATTFCPQLDAYGQLKTGYTWSGVPHASTSTRAATTLRTYYVPSAEKGAYAVRFIASANRPDSAAYLFSSGTTTTTFLSAGLYRVGGVTYVIPIIYINGSIVSQAGVSIPLTEGQEYTYVYEWEGDEYRLHLSNGESRTAALPANRTNPTSGVWSLGHYGLHSNTAFTGAVAFDRPLTESERIKLFETEDWEWDSAYQKVGGTLRQESIVPINATKQESTSPLAVFRLPATSIG